MMINDDGKFHDNSTGMIQVTTVHYQKKTCYQIASNQKCFVHPLQINYIKCILINRHE